MFSQNSRSKWIVLFYVLTVVVLSAMSWSVVLPTSPVVAGFTEEPPKSPPESPPESPPKSPPESPPKSPPESPPTECLGAIRGQVTDLCTGEPATGMRVAINGVMVTTDSKGEFSLTGTPPGDYDISLPDVVDEWMPTHQMSFLDCDGDIWAQMTYDSCLPAAEAAPPPLLPETGGAQQQPFPTAAWWLLAAAGVVALSSLGFSMSGRQ